MSSIAEITEKAVMQLLDQAYDFALSGKNLAGIRLDSAEELANDYLKEKGSLTEQVNALIRNQNKMAGITGFAYASGQVILNL